MNPFVYSKYNILYLNKFLIDEEEDCIGEDSSDNTLPYAIIKLMKQKRQSLRVESIAKALKEKEKFFRKSNGAKYTGDFISSVKSTLRTSGLFSKQRDGSYFYKNKEAEEYLSKSKNKEKKRKKKDFKLDNLSIDYSFSTSSNSFYFPIQAKDTKSKEDKIPIHLKIKLNKVNETIQRMMVKYQSENKKYDGIMICINLFKSLIDKYLFFIKMKKINSIRDLGVLNDKIIAICAKIEKIEKNEIKIPEIEKFVSKIDEYAKINDINLNHFEGNNNLFSEPPTTCSN